MAGGKGPLNPHSFVCSQVKAYSTPPPAVELVLCAVMVLRRCEATWVEAKKQLGNTSFLNSLVTFDKDTLTDSVLSKIVKYTRKPEFDPESVGKVSRAAKSLAMWVVAMEMYGPSSTTAILGMFSSLPPKLI